MKFIHSIVQSSSPPSISGTFPDRQQTHYPHPSLPQPLATSGLLSVVLNLTILGTSFLQEELYVCPFACGLFHLAHIFTVCPHRSMRQHFLPFYG